MERAKVRQGMAVVWVVAAALGMGGCTFVRRGLVSSALASHLYERPLDQVWDEARRLVTELGYEYQETTDARGVRQLVTEWKEGPDGATFTRVTAVGASYGEGLCRVNFVSGYTSLGSVPGIGVDLPRGMGRRAPGPTAASRAGRDLGLEARLLLRVEPAAARGLSADVEADVSGERSVLAQRSR